MSESVLTSNDSASRQGPAVWNVVALEEKVVEEQGTFCFSGGIKGDILLFGSNGAQKPDGPFPRSRIK